MSSERGFNESEWPITRLARPHGRAEAFLTAGEANAAERLRLDYSRAQLMPGIGQRWDLQPRGERRGNGAGDITDQAIDARRRLEGATRTVGPELWSLLVDVCCYLKGLETVERERSWPVRSAKVVLKVGLASLARHYGTESGGRSSGIRRWGTPDSRPTARRQDAC